MRFGARLSEWTQGDAARSLLTALGCDFHANDVSKYVFQYNRIKMDIKSGNTGERLIESITEEIQRIDEVYKHLHKELEDSVNAALAADFEVEQTIYASLVMQVHTLYVYSAITILAIEKIAKKAQRRSALNGKGVMALLARAYGTGQINFQLLWDLWTELGDFSPPITINYQERIEQYVRDNSILFQHAKDMQKSALFEVAPKLLQKMSPTASSAFCAVCFSNFPEENRLLLKCGHSYCSHCVERLRCSRHRQCPTCRADCVFDPLYAVATDFLGRKPNQTFMLVRRRIEVDAVNPSESDSCDCGSDEERNTAMKNVLAFHIDETQLPPYHVIYET